LFIGDDDDDHHHLSKKKEKSDHIRFHFLSTSSSLIFLFIPPRLLMNAEPMNSRNYPQHQEMCLYPHLG
jgi:hypothetical protein